MGPKKNKSFKIKSVVALYRIPIYVNDLIKPVSILTNVKREENNVGSYNKPNLFLPNTQGVRQDTIIFIFDGQTSRWNVPFLAYLMENILFHLSLR